MNDIDAALLMLLASSPQSDITRKAFKILHQALSSLCLPSDVTARDQISQALPLCICILQVSLDP